MSAPRYINGKNYEIQIRNCLTSMIKLLDQISAVNKNVTLKCDGLEFTVSNHISFNSSGHTYRLSENYSLKISCKHRCKYAILCFLINNVQTKTFSGFEVKISFESLGTKEIIVQIPFYGIKFFIKYYQDTKYLSIQLRDLADFNDEIDYESTWMVVDFLNQTISHGPRYAMAF